tara:strand:+ start:519 stop:665 length:147 start_codon:yes stop_codon:yes gene_type:complete
MELKNLKKLIQKSCKPVVLVGSGIKISETKKELYKFINKNSIPLVKLF